MKLIKEHSDALEHLAKMDNTTVAKQIKVALNFYITLRTLSTSEQNKISKIVGKRFTEICNEGKMKVNSTCQHNSEIND